MRYLSKIFLSICLVTGLGAATAYAQMPSNITLEASIPHAFVVGNTTLPAGKYTIAVADYDDPSVLEIRSADGRTSAVFETDSARADQAPNKSELVFDKVGDRNFLSQIFFEGEKSGSQVPTSRMEKRLEDKGLKAEQHSVAGIKRESKRSNQSASTGP